MTAFAALATITMTAGPENQSNRSRTSFYKFSRQGPPEGFRMALGFGGVDTFAEEEEEEEVVICGTSGALMLGSAFFLALGCSRFRDC